MKPIVVSLAWGEKYISYLDYFLKALEKFGLEFEVCVKNGEPTSIKAARQMKPQLLMEAMKKRNQSVVWMDVDSVVENDPTELYDIKDADVAIFGPNDRQYWSGTAWFNTTPKAMAVLDRWDTLCKEDAPTIRGTYDEEYLTDAIFDCSARVKRLEPSYCWQEEWLAPIYKNVTPVIRHFGISKTKEQV